MLKDFPRINPRGATLALAPLEDPWYSVGEYSTWLHASRLGDRKKIALEHLTQTRDQSVSTPRKFQSSYKRQGNLTSMQKQLPGPHPGSCFLYPLLTVSD